MMIRFKVSRMSAVIKVSRSGYYGWRGRKESDAIKRIELC